MAQNYFEGQIALGNGSASFVELTSSSGYSRKDIAFVPVVNGDTSNKAPVSWTAPVGWQSITQLGIYDVSGNLVLYWTIASVTLIQGQSLVYVPGMLQIYSSDLDVNPSGSFSYQAGVKVGIVPGGTPVFAGSQVKTSSSQTPTISVGVIAPPDNVTIRAPTPRDDVTRGYSVGNFWTLNGLVYQCVQNTTGAAVWRRYGATAAPLDAVPTALAAYGTKRLRAAYAGHCINVVRASDSTALDVDFLANGDLDTKTLDAFLQGTTGRIATWYDQSGNAANATQATPANRPTILSTNLCGNARSIVFDTTVTSVPTSQESLVIPVGVAVASSNTSSMFAVGRQMTNHDSVYCEWSNAANHPFILGASMDYTGFGTNPGVFMLRVSQLGIPGVQAQQTAGVEGSVLGTNTQQIWFNDKTNAATATLTGFALAGGVIGARSDTTTSGYCETAAVILYGRTLTVSAEVPTLQASLHALFGLAPQVRDVLMFDGDSITQGTNSIFLLDYPRKTVDLLGRPVNASNNGYTGLTIDSSITNYPTQVAPSFNPLAKNNILLIFSGTNNIAGGSPESAASTYAKLTTYVAIAKATGFRVIVGTMLPRSAMTSPMQVQWAAYNVLIRAGLAGADDIADFQADPTMGPFAASSNAALYPDGIHPSDAGYDYLAQIAADAITRQLR